MTMEIKENQELLGTLRLPDLMRLTRHVNDPLPEELPLYI